LQDQRSYQTTWKKKSSNLSKEIHDSATVPALLPPMSTQVEKDAMPFAEKKMTDHKHNDYSHVI
jgi:hypothetical protein